MVRAVLVWAGALLLLAGLARTGLRVRELERGELEFESAARKLSELTDAPGSTRVSARLATVDLREGEQALFELCSGDRLDPARWRSSMDIAVFALPEMKLMLRVPLDDAHLEAAQRNAYGACLQLGRGMIDHTARYSVDAVWPGRPPSAALTQVPLQVRVLAMRPLVPLDRITVIALGAGVLLLLLALALRRPPKEPTVDAVEHDASSTDGSTAAWDASARSLVGAAIALFALLVVTRLPSEGPSATLLKGLLLVALQTGGVIALARAVQRGAPFAGPLAIGAPAGSLRWLVAALAVGAACVACAKLALRLVPATSEAPIQTFVSWPSGRLCFAALGVLLPLGEELFFRGYLYRTALRFGRAAAFWITLSLFVVLHAEQSFGNWGGLLSIGFTGVALTALRAQSGSVLVPALAHVLYNFTLSMASF